MFSREGRKQGGFLVIKDHKHDRSSSTEGEFVGLIITVVYPDAQKQYVRQIPWLYMEIDIFSVALLSKRETIRMCPCHALRRARDLLDFWAREYFLCYEARSL